MSTYIGGRIIPKHAGTWDEQAEYETLTVVLDEETGDSYISRKAVPAGTALDDEEYWAKSSDYSVQLKNIQDAVDVLEAQVAANVTASTDEDADYAAEVVDARIDADGNTHDSLGAHIRTLDSDMEDVSDYLNSVFSDGEWEDITDSCEVADGWYYSYGTFFGTGLSGCQCTGLIPVASGEIYRVSGYKDTYLYGVLLYKSEDDTDPITYFNSDDVEASSSTFADFELAIPVGYVYMRVQTRNYETQPIVVKKFVASGLYKYANSPIALRESVDELAGSVEETEESIASAEERIDEAEERLDQVEEDISAVDYGTVFADGEWEDITDSCGVDSGWYRYNGTFVEGTTTQCTEMISVAQGEIYRVSGYNLQDLIGILFYTDEDDSEPVTYFSADDGNTVFTDFDIMVPAGCVYMRVQTYNCSKQSIVVKKLLASELYQYKNIPIALRESLDASDERIDDLEDRIEQAEESVGSVDYDTIFADGEWEDITDSCEITDGWYYSGGSFAGTGISGCQCTGLISVISGEIYRVSGYKDTNLYGVLLYTGEDDTAPLTYFNASDVEASSAKFTDFDLIIPVGYVYMRVQTRNYEIQPIVVQKFIASELYKSKNIPIALRESINAIETDVDTLEESLGDLEEAVSDIQSTLGVDTDSGDEESTDAVDHDTIFADGEWEDITDSCEVSDGWYYSYGLFFGTGLSGCQCTGLIPVTSGEIYRVSGYKDTNLYGVLLYASEDDTDPITYFNAVDVEASSAKFTDFDLIIPVGYVYMRVQTRYYETQPIVVKKFVASELYKSKNIPIALRESIEAAEESIEALEEDVSEIQDALGISTEDETIDYGEWLAYNTMLQIQGATRNRDYEFDDMDTGLVVIVIDDLRHDMDLVASIIVGEYGFPLCVAAIPGNLGNSVNGIEDEDSQIGDTTQEICEYVVENGGEILSHYGPVLTQERAYDEEFLKAYFETTKNTLYNAGFTKVNGIIMAGGTDELYGKNDESGNMDKYSRMFYQYSDHCGKMEPYEHARKSMVTALDTFKSYVDSVVTNKSWFATFFHTIDGTEGTSVFDDGFQEAELRERLDYIKEYVDAGTLEVVTYYDIYNTYGHYA